LLGGLAALAYVTLI